MCWCARSRHSTLTFSRAEHEVSLPIFIIDEDFRSEMPSGLGTAALAAAIEKEGMEYSGHSYGDLTSFAQQQSRASAFLLSIDDERFVRAAKRKPRSH